MRAIVVERWTDPSELKVQEVPEPEVSGTGVSFYLTGEDATIARETAEKTAKFYCGESEPEE